MALTTVARVKDLIGQSGSAFHNSYDEDAITNAVNGANSLIEKWGVASTETAAGVLMMADRLACSFLLDGDILRMARRGESQAVGSYRLAANELSALALVGVSPFVTGLSFRKPSVVANRNAYFGRGGPLHSGTEAGSYQRSVR